MNPSFLDILPKEIFDNVLRFFSRLPKAKSWETHILLEDLIALFGVDGQVGTVMKTRFTALCVSNTGDCVSEKNEFHWELPSEGMLSTSDINVARAYVLAGGGQALHTLAIGLRMYREEVDEVGIVDDFANNCPNVTSLSVHDLGQGWVARFGKQLRKLQCATFTADGIAQKCTSLQELNLCLFSRSANLAGDGLWEKVGDNLKKLTLKWVSTSVSDDYGYLEKIGQHCRKLRVIDIFGCANNREQITNLLCSYGDQLECAYLYYMGATQLTDLVNACKFCRFHLPLARGTPVLDSIRILKHQLESINVDYTIPGRDYSEFEKAWDGCVNLRRLYIKGGNIEDMKALMSTPKAHLDTLYIRMFHLSKKAAKEVLDICARGCENLKELSYSGPMLPLNGFESFIAPKSSLQSISLLLNSASYEKYLEIIDPFVRASVSVELSLMGTIFEDVHKKFVDRGVFIRGGYGIPRYLE